MGNAHIERFLDLFGIDIFQFEIFDRKYVAKAGTKAHILAVFDTLIDPTTTTRDLSREVYSSL